MYRAKDLEVDQGKHEKKKHINIEIYFTLNYLDVVFSSYIIEKTKINKRKPIKKKEIFYNLYSKENEFCLFI